MSSAKDLSMVRPPVSVLLEELPGVGRVIVNTLKPKTERNTVRQPKTSAHPNVLFAHGLGTTHHSMHDISNKFRLRRRRTYVITKPGKKAVTNDLSHEFLACALASLEKAYTDGGNEPVDIVGHSLGSKVAEYLCTMRPEMVGNVHVLTGVMLSKYEDALKTANVGWAFKLPMLLAPWKYPMDMIKNWPVFGKENVTKHKWSSQIALRDPVTNALMGDFATHVDPEVLLHAHTDYIPGGHADALHTELSANIALFRLEYGPKAKLPESLARQVMTRNDVLTFLSERRTPIVVKAASSIAGALRAVVSWGAVRDQAAIDESRAIFQREVNGDRTRELAEQSREAEKALEDEYRDAARISVPANGEGIITLEASKVVAREPRGKGHLRLVASNRIVRKAKPVAIEQAAPPLVPVAGH